MSLTAGSESRILRDQGFDVYCLQTEQLEVQVVPELGAKIISLRNRRTGREWLWHPARGRRLFRNRLGDDFSQSPLVGVDECLPTIASCAAWGRILPDHGEIWSGQWKIDEAGWALGVLRTLIELPVSPLVFERTLEISEAELRLDYRLQNRSPQDVPFLWAMHPLLQVKRGDQLQLPPSTRALVRGEDWLDALDGAVPAGGCAKAFAHPVREGVAAIENVHDAERLELRWDPKQNNTLGLWLTRGGWHGHHHLAIEPTNGAPDALDVAAANNRCGIIPAGGVKSWWVTVRVDSFTEQHK